MSRFRAGGGHPPAVPADDPDRLPAALTVNDVFTAADDLAVVKPEADWRTTLWATGSPHPPSGAL